ncbi:aromatic ring-hydroxylating dioxygenase subunit alpha [Rhodobacter sp. NTK016B]|uniref:aromatic ring-hydroxylating oxygenase subunit alpha n=1 Tax=Rhodobacter sp. NTK016B TaxID=2759676 RepID=UPI001A8F773A|nr:aromatic ring-hydroxylating dioxygenase subunit alpha [Rhodobacter sp. NTK016B]MBN8291164.1 aromatic ring-hydroxylating dioxygenase subunit alpha [Rhodobacter sp. NTK016B]
MLTDPATKARIEARVNEGLRGHWYPVAKSVQISASRPYGTKVLGEKIVLWRDRSGKIRCIEDYCPHRGAPLSYGEVHDGNIGCRYHGVIVDGTGTVQRVPAMPDCAMEGRKALRDFVVQEAHDAVFVYIPSVDRPEPPELPLPKELSDPEWTGFLCTSVWDVNYRYALDNLADPMHGCYLHAESFTLAFGSKQDLLELDRRDDGFRVSRVGQTGENFDWSEFVVAESGMFCFLDIPYPPSAGPGGNMRILGYVCPIDETHCKVFFWRMRKVDGVARQSWRFLYRTMLEERHWAVLEQDRVMLEGMPDDARKREMLYQHDIGVAHLRRALNSAAKAQIAAEDSAA